MVGVWLASRLRTKGPTAGYLILAAPGSPLAASAIQPEVSGDDCSESRVKRIMPEPRLLKRAPIREAIVDVRVPIPDQPDLSALESLARSLKGYPNVQVAMSVVAEWVMKPEGKVEQGHKTAPAGFRALSQDGLQIVQLRPDGVSLSRLEPYVSWPHLRDEASQVFAAYREAIGCPEILRLGLRYINNLRLPYPVVDLEDWVLGLPKIPDEWPQSVSTFLYRQTLHDRDSGHAVNVMHALADDVDETKIGVIFDIDAYSGEGVSANDDGLWGTFDELRDLKNRIFFSGVTERTLDLFD